MSFDIRHLKFIIPERGFFIAMFTGIITHLGKVQQKDNTIFTFSAEHSLISHLEQGTSISVNGVCLTVLAKPTTDEFSVEIMPETQQKTTIQSLQENDIVNLELPATPTSFLSGHIVQGHVDTTAKIIEIKEDGNSHLLTFESKPELTKYIIEKGSITINGISLTVISIHDNQFTVGIIPHTWKHTMLHTIQTDDLVNVEVDVLAKYIEKLTQ